MRASSARQPAVPVRHRMGGGDPGITGVVRRRYTSRNRARLRPPCSTSSPPGSPNRNADEPPDHHFRSLGATPVLTCRCPLYWHITLTAPKSLRCARHARLWDKSCRSSMNTVADLTRRHPPGYSRVPRHNLRMVNAGRSRRRGQFPAHVAGDATDIFDERGLRLLPRLYWFAALVESSGADDDLPGRFARAIEAISDSIGPTSAPAAPSGSRAHFPARSRRWRAIQRA